MSPRRATLNAAMFAVTHIFDKNLSQQFDENTWKALCQSKLFCNDEYFVSFGEEDVKNVLRRQFTVLHDSDVEILTALKNMYIASSNHQYRLQFR